MDIFKNIDSFIQNQYPIWYQENGPNFIAFLTAYYQWLEEEGNALYYSRNYYNIRDIDTTFDQFIIYFKEKYFLNVPLGTAADIRTLIKHALDIYRSKGTEQSVQLLFQLAYGEQPSFYYPSTDLFKLSDGNWFQPRYLELNLAENNFSLEQKEVKGATSNAIGFVDAVVRRYTNQRLQDVAYISAISGVFKAGEAIVPTDGSLSVTEAPLLKGSLNSINLPASGTGLNYTPGTIVAVKSQSGNNAQYLITNTTSESVVTLEFDDGGYGFTTTPNIYMSTTNLTLSNVVISNTDPLFNNAWTFLDVVTQPLASLNYRQANGSLVLGQFITTYNNNVSVMGTGYIIGINQTNATDGQATISVLSGNVGNSFYVTGNVVGANLTLANGYTNITATGQYIANSNVCNLMLNAVVGSGFLLDEDVISQNPERTVTWGSGVVSSYSPSMSNTTMAVAMERGIIYSNNILIGSVSGTVANVVSVSTQIGLVNVVNVFVGSNLAYTFSNLMSANCSNAAVISGNVSISLAPNLLNPEVILNPTDVIAPFVAVPLNNPSYGFPGAPSGNLGHLTIGQMLSYANMTVGEIANIFFTGSSLTSAQEPYIAIDQPQVTDRKLYDDVLAYVGASGVFPVGDVITQGVSNARGRVRSSSNSTVLVLKRMRYANDFLLTTNTSTLLVGTFSGFTANCTNVAFDVDSQPMGHNIQLGLDYTVGNGVIVSGKVVDSGYGFVQDEALTLGANAAFGTANVSNYGTGSGYYANVGGELSGPKRLFDGYFYQNYSYEVISSLLLPKYQALLFDLTHVAGTQLFGRFILSNTSPSTIGLAQNTFRSGNQFAVSTRSAVVSTHAKLTTANVKGKILTSHVNAGFLLGTRSLTRGLVFNALGTVTTAKAINSQHYSFTFNVQARVPVANTHGNTSPLGAKALGSRVVGQ